LNKGSIISRSPEQSRSIGSQLVQSITKPLVIALYGDLGSGKTCFAQGIAAGLGIQRLITSPTFTILNEYAGTRPLYHFDLYRLNGPNDLLNMGFQEYCETDSIVLLEWAERAESVLPQNTIRIRISIGQIPDDRIIEWETSIPLSFQPV
jgi:tRNA threonylcarbamoyladenosine biosynthesis protein TsaE